MLAVPSPSLHAERRDLRTRALRNMLAERLACHPGRLAGLSAEVVAAMLEEISEPRRVGAAHARAGGVATATVVTPEWDSRAG